MKVTAANAVLAYILETVVATYFFPQVFTQSPFVSCLTVLLACNLSMFTLYKLVLYPFMLSPLRRIPRARGFVPFLGQGWIMFKRPPGNEHLKMMKNVDNDGLILFRGFLHDDRLLITNPDAIADVLVHNNYDFEKPPGSRAFLRKFLGDGLLMTEGDEHKHHRKHIMPAFHFRHIKELYPVFWSKSLDFCRALKRELRENPARVLEIGHYSTQVTLDIIGLAGLGRDINSLKNSDDQLIENYEEILEPTTEKAVYFLLHLVFSPSIIGMMPWSLNSRVKITTGNLKRICKEFVIDKKQKMKHEGHESVDILSIMLRSNNFSDDNLVDQLLTFLAAGHETTSGALTWASYLLSLHPHAQTRLRNEIHEAIPDPQALSGSASGISELLERLPYLNGVCNEVLRLFPTIPVSARISIRDTTINGQFVPAKTMVFVVPWAVNRNPKLWGSDAEHFAPDRWIDKESGRATMNGGAESNYAFLTFLHGPRSCIGEKFARAELRALLASMVGSFEFQLADPEEKVIVGGTVTSKPVNGMHLKMVSTLWGS